MNYYEPWAATARRVAFDDPFPWPVTDGDGIDPDAAVRQRDAALRLAARVDWLVLGSNVTPKEAVVSLLGKESTTDGRQILAEFRKPVGEKGGASAEALAKRAVACVNAMNGVDDPAAWVAKARALMNPKKGGV